jgi:paraquat-inducible protein A
VRRAAALTCAALLLYAPANLYPIATLPVGFTPTHYTVLEGVRDLLEARLFGLAFLIFCASFLIPILKLVGMSWFIVSVLRRSRRALVFRTRLYRAIEVIGRWSMIDPFVIGAFVPVMHYNNFVYARGEPAAAAFSFVVVGTMLAARSFDPRLMWDAAEGRLK